MPTLHLVTDNTKYYWADQNGWVHKDRLTKEEAIRLGIAENRTPYSESDALPIYDGLDEYWD